MISQRAFLHFSLQYFTSSQTFSHFFLQVKGLLQDTQILVGKSAFLTPFMLSGYKNNEVILARKQAFISC